MNFILKNISLPGTIIVTTSFLASSAFATESEPLSKGYCLGGNIICITETYDPIESASKETDISYYNITNNGDTQIYGFAMSNVSGNGLQTYVSPEISGGWEGETFSKATWDDTRKRIEFRASNGAVIESWTTGDTSIDGAKPLGAFEDIFGPSVNDAGETVYANFYWNPRSAYFLRKGVTLGVSNNGGSLGQLYTYGLPESSEAIIFDYHGSTIASSRSFLGEDNSLIDSSTTTEEVDSTTGSSTANTGGGTSSETSGTNLGGGSETTALVTGEASTPTALQGTASNNVVVIEESPQATSDPNIVDNTAIQAVPDDIMTNESSDISSNNGRASVLAVPEPSTYAMLLAGLGLLGLMSRRTKQ